MSVHRSKQKSPQKAVWGAFVFAALAMLVFVLINLPYRYEEFSGEWLVPTTIEFRSLSPGDSRNAIRAGFPFRFFETWVSYDTHGTVFCVREKPSH